MRRLRPLTGALAVLALLAVGCGDDDGAGDGTTTTSTSSTTSSTTTTTTTTTTTPPGPTTPIGDADLPGTAFDPTPQPGQVLSVIGVAHDDVLNVRRAPGTDQDIVAELGPLADDFVATGRARMLTLSLIHI